jgi:hypothetical protein
LKPAPTSGYHVRWLSIAPDPRIADATEADPIQKTSHIAPGAI